MKNILTLYFILALTFTSQAQEKQTITKVDEDCDCPEPTRDQIQGVCGSIYNKESANEGSRFADRYQEDMWLLACADLNGSIEDANKKIRCIWNKHKEKFRCYNFTSVSVSNANILKFSIDTGFNAFLVMAIKKWKIDVNFIDPADDKTILDFLKEQKEHYKNTRYTEKEEEYERFYNLLKEYGAKHAKDL